MVDIVQALCYNKSCNKIVTNEDEKVRASYILLSRLVGQALETGIDLLGLKAPEKM